MINVTTKFNLCYTATDHIYEKEFSVINIILNVVNIDNITCTIHISSSLEDRDDELYKKATLYVSLFDKQGAVDFNKDHLENIIEKSVVGDISYAINDILESVKHVQEKITIAIMREFLRIGYVIDESVLKRYNERFILKEVQES